MRLRNYIASLHVAHETATRRREKAAGKVLIVQMRVRVWMTSPREAALLLACAEAFPLGAVSPAWAVMR